MIYPPDRMAIVAGVLVGGHSRRMGTPKALLPHANGGTYLHHSIRVAQDLSGEVVMLGRPPFELPPDLTRIESLPDRCADSGPLGGLASLLSLAGDRWALLLPCDLPLLRVDCLLHLWSALAGRTRALVYADTGDCSALHPCCAYYHGSLMSVASQRLAEGRRSLSDFLNAAGAQIVPLPGRFAHHVTNVNTPASLRHVAGR